MRFPRLAALLIAAPAMAQQTLVCPAPSSASAQACEVYHYHMQMYRPETRLFAELTGINQFASQSACDRYREAHIRRNLAIVDYFKRVKNEQQYEPDRFGPCHCDMTVEKTSPAFLSDQQRLIQLRTAEDIRLRVREKLLDSGLKSDSELVRGLISPPAPLPILGGSKLVPVAAPTTATSVANSPDDLKSTKAVDTSKPLLIALDLPLADVSAPTAPPPPEISGGPPTPAAATGDAVAAAPQSNDNASDAAESFISYETQRIQSVLKASGAITDETVKSKIFEACQQRIQLLSNLRTLIEGSGSRSRLASAARSAQSESDRLALVTKLFGTSIAPEWAPKDATDVVLRPIAEVDTEPERVLRDTSGRWSDQQKKRALYVLLARSQPTDEQQLWLITVLDSFLR